MPRIPIGYTVTGLAVMAGLASACGQARAGPKLAEPPPLPAPVANNAVASVHTETGWALFSFLGIDSTKAWNGVTTTSYRWDLGTTEWREIAAPPGPGRLAATAQTLGGKIFLFGGYTVAEDGTERSLPQVDVYDPETEAWTAAAPMPVPVDDAMSGVWRDSLIYLVSGWHDSDNVANVQIFDPAKNAWRQATPIPGPPVFGHAGGIAGDAIVYVDGVRVDTEPRRFSLEPSSWLGRIDPTDPGRIDWTRLPAHPGPPLYRAAAIGRGSAVFFMGGSDNPYNYNGLGYDGRAAQALPGVWAFEVDEQRWVELDPLETASMDHRGVIVADGRAFLVGGMIAGQQVTNRVSEIRLP